MYAINMRINLSLDAFLMDQCNYFHSACFKQLHSPSILSFHWDCMWHVVFFRLSNYLSFILTAFICYKLWWKCQGFFFGASNWEINQNATVTYLCSLMKSLFSKPSTVNCDPHFASFNTHAHFLHIMTIQLTCKDI